MNILASTKLGTTPKGHAELVQLIIEQAELDSEEELILVEDEVVERYIQCATHALPYFSVCRHNIFTIFSSINLFPVDRPNSNRRRSSSMLARNCSRCTHGNWLEPPKAIKTNCICGCWKFSPRWHHRVERSKKPTNILTLFSMCCR